MASKGRFAGVVMATEINATYYASQFRGMWYSKANDSSIGLVEIQGNEFLIFETKFVMEISGFEGHGSIIAGNIFHTIVRVLDSKINQLFAYVGADNSEFEYGGIIRGGEQADLIVIDSNFTSIMVVKQNGEGANVGQLTGLLNDSHFNLTDVLDGFVLIYLSQDKCIHFQGVIAGIMNKRIRRT